MSTTSSSETMEAKLSATRISYADTGYFSRLVADYQNGDTDLLKLAAFAPNKEGLAAAMKAIEKKTFPRQELIAALEKQYAGLPAEAAVKRNIEALGKDAVCVVAAHQLNLLTGPLYVIYKTVSAILLARQLEAAHPGRQVVPVYWLGTEDHDRDEIDHFRLFGKTMRWETDQTGATGDMNLRGMDAVYEAMAAMLGPDEHATSLLELFREAYMGSGTLAQAQRRLLHRLFGRYGLVILDANTPALKRPFSVVAKDELLTGFAEQYGEKTRAFLADRYHLQASPRAINLFALAPGRRERVEPDGDGFRLAETGETWSRQETLARLEEHPEAFSPNVVLRPLHQQAVLPAVAFLGGGSEVAYWLQLKAHFEAAGIFMPVVLLRNSVLWIDAVSAEKWDGLGLDIPAMFSEEEALVKRWVHDHETVDLSLAEERKQMEALYKGIASRAELVDPTLVGKVAAEGANQQKAMDKLEQRLVKAAKQKHENQVQQLRKVLARLFPSRGLQERHDNFSSLWLRHGEAFLDALMESLDPLDPRFTVIQESRN